MKKKKKTKVDLLLEVLSDYLSHSTDELSNKVGHRFGDAVYKARCLGYNIETKRIGLENRYRLILD